MNSVMEIGDNVLFMYQGKALWQGNKDSILDADVKELQDFVFANRLMRNFQK
jgi:phospholipid/cholesterol/gamma-HCH transport system ATP-binding protein